ncbi:MAG: hypothetical protein GQ523_07810 [Methanophagales archaeon]|nr:hypothetical protein [Methanophagales archaeon]
MRIDRRRKSLFPKVWLKSAIVNMLNAEQSSKWRGMSPASMENIALFGPA